jgi:hypothetical protein
LKNKVLIALLISFIAFFPPKLFANEEESNIECFEDIKKKVKSVIKKGRNNFVIGKNAKRLLLYSLQVNKEIDLEGIKGSLRLEKCSFESAIDLYNFYKDDIENYINEEALIISPDKREQKNGNIVIFKSITKNVPLNLDSGPQITELEQEASPPKKIINLNNRSDELIKATIDIKELFIKYGLNQNAQYKEAASELIKRVDNKWIEIKEDRCKQKDYQDTLDRCQQKQIIISEFKNEDLPELKHIQIFKNNKVKIDSCFNNEGFNEKNCSTNEKIKSESPSEYLKN